MSHNNVVMAAGAIIERLQARRAIVRDIQTHLMHVSTYADDDLNEAIQRWFAYTIREREVYNTLIAQLSIFIKTYGKPTRKQEDKTPVRKMLLGN